MGVGGVDVDLFGDGFEVQPLFYRDDIWIGGEVCLQFEEGALYRFERVYGGLGQYRARARLYLPTLAPASIRTEGWNPAIFRMTVSSPLELMS